MNVHRIVAAIIALPALAQGAPVTFAAGGDNNPASIQATVDAFRAALGTPSNGNSPGPIAGGRREINWDGGGPPVVDGTPAVTPFTVFQNTRGATFTTPGSGLTQATASGGLLSLDLINPSYAVSFAPFSPNRLFTPLASNITDVVFSLPGTTGSVQATVGSFGAVFTDVDLANTTKIDFYDALDNLVHSGSAIPGTVANGSLSFLGVVFDAGVGITRVRITTGNAALGPTDGGTVDVVVMDDLLYSDPQQLVPVPEPSTLALFAIGVAGLIGSQCRRKTAVPPA
jgi:PEP-CTERM motif